MCQYQVQYFIGSTCRTSNRIGHCIRQAPVNDKWKWICLGRNTPLNSRGKTNNNLRRRRAAERVEKEKLFKKISTCLYARDRPVSIHWCCDDDCVWEGRCQTDDSTIKDPDCRWKNTEHFKGSQCSHITSFLLLYFFTSCYPIKSSACLLQWWVQSSFFSAKLVRSFNLFAMILTGNFVVLRCRRLGWRFGCWRAVQVTSFSNTCFKHSWCWGNNTIFFLNWKPKTSLQTRVPLLPTSISVVPVVQQTSL